jgi:hypothetical protein
VAKYKTFDEYVKGEHIVRYLSSMRACWNFATDAAVENGSSHNTASTPCCDHQWTINRLRTCKKCGAIDTVV